MIAATVLIVHDEPSLRKLLRIRLENDGIRVREVHNVRRAVEEFTSMADEIAVVISGVRMAGLDGMELLNAIRQVPSNVPVYFFTSYPPKDEPPLPPGVELFQKPHELNALIRAVRNIIPIGYIAAGTG